MKGLPPKYSKKKLICETQDVQLLRISSFLKDLAAIDLRCICYLMSWIQITITFNELLLIMIS